jgi:hypothetical protein
VPHPRATAWPVRRRRWLPDNEVGGVGTSEVGAIFRASGGAKSLPWGWDRYEAAEETARRRSPWWPVARVDPDGPYSRRGGRGVSRVHQFGARVREKVCSSRNRQSCGDGPKSEELWRSLVLRHGH